MFRHFRFLFASTALLVGSFPVHAQVKDDFARALLEFATAARGQSGDEGPAMLSAVDEMAEGLTQWDAAVARMESGLASALGAAPSATAARMRAALGAAYLERGRLDDAHAQFDAAAALDPQFADIHILKGVASELANRPSNAASAYRAAWERQPDDVVAAYLALRAAGSPSDTSRLTSALTALSSAVERGGEPAAAAFLTARLLDEASVAEPLFLPALYSMSLESLSSAKYDEAVTRLREVAAVDPLARDRALQSAEARVGAAELRRQNAGSAIAALTGALERHPESPEVHRLLGLAHWMDRRYDTSLLHLRTAVRMNPSDERARIAMADVLFESGDPAGARQTLHELTVAIPASAEGHWKLGRLSQLLGDEESALRSFQSTSALPLLAGASHVFAAIGRIYHNQLDLDGAASAYARRVSLVPNSAAAHLDLGDVYRAQDLLDAALAEYSMASLLEPTNVRALAGAAQVHTAASRDEVAVRLLRRAVALDPSHLEARYAFSRALLRVGAAEEARKELETFELLQSKAMQDERRRFEENQVKIEKALERSGQKENAR